MPAVDQIGWKVASFQTGVSIFDGTQTITSRLNDKALQNNLQSCFKMEYDNVNLNLDEDISALDQVIVNQNVIVDQNDWTEEVWWWLFNKSVACFSIFV